MAKQITVENLRKVAEEFVSNGTYSVERFKKNFEKDPLGAFEYSDQTIMYAARLWMGQTVLAWCNKNTGEKVAEDIMTEIVRIYHREALFPTYSTNPTANEAARQKASAAAEFAEKFGR